MHSRGRPDAAAAAAKLSPAVPARTSACGAVNRKAKSHAILTHRSVTDALRQKARLGLAMLQNPPDDSGPPSSRAPSAEPLRLSISSKRIARALAAATAAVSIAGLIVEAIKPRYKLKDDRGVLPMLSLSYEQNLPTFYTVALLLLCALLLALIAAAKRKSKAPYALHTLFLSLGFTYIAFDELAAVHEGLGVFKQTGLLYFSWVIPAFFVVAAVGIAYLRFLLHLPPKIRRAFIIAGALYVLGAVGMELPLGYWTEQHGSDNFTYAFIDWIEETLEMAGLTLFAPTLIDYLSNLNVLTAFFPAPPSSSPSKEPPAP